MRIAVVVTEETPGRIDAKENPTYVRFNWRSLNGHKNHTAEEAAAATAQNHSNHTATLPFSTVPYCHPCYYFCCCIPRPSNTPFYP